jgi:hypothetical protein
VAPATWTEDYQFAECLYMMVSTIRDDRGAAMDFFKEDEIDDVDGDGMPEILDGWGRPIMFLRWAPGFTYWWGIDQRWGVLNVDDDAQGTDDDLVERGWTLSDDVRVSDLQSPNGAASPDPFDPMQVDPRWRDTNPSTNQAKKGNEPFALIPLVFSSGRDGVYELWDAPRATPPFAYFNVVNDPYHEFTDAATSQPVQIGMPYDANGDGVLGSDDNITNHLIEAR